MTHQEFITLLKHPESVDEKQLSDLKEIVELYPFFVPARLFYTKALHISNSIHFGAVVKLTATYCSSRRWLYYYLHPEKKLSNEPYRRDRNGKSVGDYFDMMTVLESEGGDKKLSLKNLAERLKSAREMVVGISSMSKMNTVASQKPIPTKEVSPEDAYKTDPKRTIVKTDDVQMLPNADYFSSIHYDVSENSAKKLILDKKYKEAIEILTQLNLNNPKKSVYFADQIRFLEKVIENSKK